MNYINTVTLTGLVHHLSRRKEQKYFPFSVRQETNGQAGTSRKDFLNSRAFPEEVQTCLKSLDEGAPVRVRGVLRSSKGSGELYLAVLDAEQLDSLPAEPENTVELSGFVYIIKAQAEGETGTGRYVRFAVRQENQDTDGHSRKDFLVVRVYDQEQQKVFASLNDGDSVKVHGTLRSSRGSGVNYIRCVSIER
ncbi:MAG: OB-fold nucleic acid binding domain-containing protein [Synergistaceae bacterium]|nr:OB-fold nucleic acid binding domain-containing protein [Synergistaceae bacterium]